MARKRTSDNEVVVSSGAAAATAPARTVSAAKTHSKRATKASTKTSATASGFETSEPMYEPSHEEIAEQAYLYWEARGYQGGTPEEDWLRAKQELCARQTASSRA
jgi:hypothetical protein